MAVLAGANGAHASPWARPDGELLVISSAKYFQADLSSQDPAGGEFQRIESDTYLEYGLTENVTIGGKAIYGNTWLTSGGLTQTSNGFTEIEGFAQYQFLRDEKQAGSVKLSVARPAAFQSGARENFQSDSVDAEIAALYGRNIVFEPVKIFAAAEAGYRRRFGGAADLIRSQITIGTEPSEHWVFLLEGFSTISLRNEDPGGADFDIVKIQPSLVYRFNRRWAIQAGMNEEIAGRNLALGRTFFLGVWSAF
ncbi:MAG: hypothetical protein AAFW68_05115 [Pseudomonadota bacterium]